MQILLTLLRKDLLLLWRSKHIIASMFGLALLLVIIASLAFRQIGYGQSELRDLTPGILWLIYLFIGAMTLNYAFIEEYEQGALQGLTLTPVRLETVYLSKFIANLLFTTALAAVCLIAHQLFFGVEYQAVLPQLFLIVVLCGIGFCALGTLLATIAGLSPGRDLLLPLLLYPLLIPLLAASIFVTREILETGLIPWTSFWFVLICCFDLISLALAAVLFEFAFRE